VKKSSESYEVVLIPLSKIIENPDQPRLDFSIKGIQELAQSIEAEGLLQPVIVTPIGNDQYKLKCGGRRVNAFSYLGREEIPAIILEGEDSSVISLIENIQREGLPVTDEALAFKRLIDSRELSRADLARKVGKDKSYVSRMVKLGKVVEEYAEKQGAFPQLPRTSLFELMDIPELMIEAEEKQWSQKEIRIQLRKRGLRHNKSRVKKNLQDLGADIYPGSESATVLPITEDPVEWEPVVVTTDGFMIYPFKYRQGTKVNAKLVTEKLIQLKDKLDELIRIANQFQQKALSVPDDDNVILPSQG
jgi:ParB family chromosome partitioning protein